MGLRPLSLLPAWGRALSEVGSCCFVDRRYDQRTDICSLIRSSDDRRSKQAQGSIIMIFSLDLTVFVVQIDTMLVLLCSIIFLVV